MNFNTNLNRLINCLFILTRNTIQPKSRPTIRKTSKGVSNLIIFRSIDLEIETRPSFHVQHGVTFFCFQFYFLYHLYLLLGFEKTIYVATFVFCSFFGTVNLKDTLMKDRLIQSNFALDVKKQPKMFPHLISTTELILHLPICN